MESTITLVQLEIVRKYGAAIARAQARTVSSCELAQWAFKNLDCDDSSPDLVATEIKIIAYLESMPIYVMTAPRINNTAKNAVRRKSNDMFAS